MPTSTDDEIAAALAGIVADGFGRSLGTLEAAGAIDCAKLRRPYSGIGSEYYDLVTEQIQLTARSGVRAVGGFFLPEPGMSSGSSGGT